MRYFLSLPNGWAPDRKWPVVVAIESADRDFKSNAETFVQARKDLPFILVIPEVVTNGGPRYREAPGYDYSPSDWTRVEKDGPWKFDHGGLACVIEDIAQKFSGEPRYYLTGWEAGAHTVFALAFGSPERLAGVAPVCPNYARRNVVFSRWEGRQQLPIRVFAGSADPMWAPGRPLKVQTQLAEADATAHGFKFSYQVVDGKGHGPLAQEVLGWFEATRKRR